MVLRFDCRGTISIKSARERLPPSGSKSEYQRGPPGLFYCWIDSIGDKCLKTNPMALKRFHQLYGIRSHNSGWFYGKGLPAHIVTAGYVLL